MDKWYAVYSDLLYMHFSERFLQLPASAANTYSPTNPLLRLLRVLGYTLLRLVGNAFKKVEHPQKLHKKVWLYVVSQNNCDSLQFLQKDFPDTVFVAGQSKNIGKYNASVERISLRSKILYYYKFLPLFIKFFRHKMHHSLRFYDILYDAVGFYEIYYKKLKKYRPQAIVFANDHNADARAMLLAARHLDIKTIYIQHASVSTMFPPLSFDLNLLEGQDALDKYTQSGPIRGQVKLIGMPKADIFVPYRNNSKYIMAVGIGCNLLDEFKEVEKLLNILSEELPVLQILLRPHPRDNRNFAALTAISKGITLSDSRSVATFEYLQQIDVQISATSGIHLEAVLLNVWSIYYDLSPNQKIDDYYGYIKNGLVDVAETAKALTRLLRNNLNTKPNVIGRATYYNATVGTEYDGRSSKLAIKYITDYIK